MEHKQKVLLDMEVARKIQFLEKERRVAEQAKQERDQFMKIVQTQKEHLENEKRIENEKKQMMKNHSVQLR